MGNARRRKRFGEYKDPSIALDDYAMSQAISLLMASWNRYFTLILATMSVLMLAILYERHDVQIGWLSVDEENVSAVLAILFLFGNIHAWKILSSLRQLFRRAEKKRLFQFMISHEPGVFNPFTAKNYGLVVALSFGMIFALGVLISAKFFANVDISALAGWGVYYLNQPFNSILGANFNVPEAPEVARNVLGFFASHLTWVVPLIAFLVFLEGLTRTMNLLLGFGGWARTRITGYLFLFPLILTTLVSLAFFSLLLAERNGNGSSDDVVGRMFPLASGDNAVNIVL